MWTKVGTLVALLLVLAPCVVRGRKDKLSSPYSPLKNKQLSLTDVLLDSELSHLAKLSGLGDMRAASQDKDWKELSEGILSRLRLRKRGKGRVGGRGSGVLSHHYDGQVKRDDDVGSDHLLQEPLGAGNFTGKYPVLFIPGLMGSQIEVRLKDRKDAPNWLCRKTSEWSRVWIIDKLHMLPELAECWLEDVLLKWNATSASLEPVAPGIESRANPTFKGATELDKNNPTLQPLADLLTTYFGYKQGVDVVAQSYDWRAGPETWMKEGEVYDQMKDLIEKTVDGRPGKEPIVAYSISMGGPFFSLFLSKHVTQEWKDQYIHAFFSVSGVMSGSAIAPLVSISGTRFGNSGGYIPAYLKDAMDTLARSISSVPWLFPFRDAFKAEVPVVQTPGRNYSASQLGEMLADTGNAQQEALYKVNVDKFGMEALLPNVTTYCISGFGVPTPRSIVYSKDDFTGDMHLEMSDGDNCVTVESLRMCDTFGLHQKHPVYPYHMFNQTHAGLLYNTETLELFAGIITGLEE